MDPKEKEEFNKNYGELHEEESFLKRSPEESKEKNPSQKKPPRQENAGQDKNTPVRKDFSGGFKTIPPEALHPQKKSSAGIIFLIILIVLIAGGGGYYLFAMSSKETGPEPAQQATISTSTNPTPEQNTTTTEENQASTTTTENIGQTTPFLSAHNSFFKNPSDQIRELTISTLGIDFKTFFQPFAPDIFDNEFIKNFNPDFTFFIYTNQNGLWPGSVIQAKPDNQTLEEIKEKVRDIENKDSALLAKTFFYTHPGKANTWKDGEINGYPARYITFEKEGASLIITWLDNYLLIATNYKGAQEAASSLGY